MGLIIPNLLCGFTGGYWESRAKSARESIQDNRSSIQDRVYGDGNWSRIVDDKAERATSEPSSSDGSHGQSESLRPHYSIKRMP